MKHSHNLAIAPRAMIQHEFILPILGQAKLQSIELPCLH